MRRSSIMLIASAIGIGIASIAWAQTPVEGPATKPAAETAANSASDPPVSPATPTTSAPALQAEEVKTVPGEATAAPVSNPALLRVTIDPEVAKSKSGLTMINRLKEVDFARLVQVDVAAHTAESADKNRTLKMSGKLKVGDPVFLPQVLVVVERIARANVLDSIRFEPKTDLDSNPALPAQSIAGTVIAPPETSYADVSKALRALSDAGVMPVSFTPAAGATLSESAPFAARLLILEEDWSKSPTAKEAEAELRMVLASVDIPNDFRDQPLLISSPNILFSPENISFYQPDHCAALIAWLQKHKLLKETIEFPAPSLDVLQEQRGGNIAASKMFINSHRHYRDDAGHIPLHSTQGDQPASPFSQMRLAADWSIDSNAETNIATIQCSIRKLTQFRGQAELSSGSALTTSSFQFELPENRVALVHGLGGRYAAYGFGYAQSPYRTNGGLFPVLMIRRTAAPLPEQPAAVWIPDSVRPANSEPRRGGGGRQLAGRGTRREPDVQPVAPAEFHVIALKQAEAESTSAQLKQLIGGKLSIIAEPRTNSILLNGTKEQLEEIKKFIAQIDSLASSPGRPLAPTAGSSGDEGPPSVSATPLGTSSGPAATTGSALGQFWSGGKSGSLIGLRTQFEVIDHKTKELAQRLKNSPDNRPIDKSDKEQLRNAVADAFLTRQKLQRKELAELSTRLRDMEKSIELRDRVQKQIIDRRVEDLLNRELRWDTDSASPIPDSPATNSGSSATRSPEEVTFTGHGASTGVKAPDVNSRYDAPAQKASDVKTHRSPDPALQGVWGLNYAGVKVDESTIPDDKKLRLVFWENRHAVFQGDRLTQLTIFTTEEGKTANWIKMKTLRFDLPDLELTPGDSVVVSAPESRNHVVDVRLEGNASIPSASILQMVKTHKGNVSGTDVYQDVKALTQTGWFARVTPIYRKEGNETVLVFRLTEFTRQTQGLYEVVGDGMRLSLSSDPQFTPDRFGTVHPEFIRLSKDIPQELLAKMELPEKPQATEQSQSQAATNFAKDVLDQSHSSTSSNNGGVIRSAGEFLRMIDDATVEQTNAEQAWKDAIGKRDGESDQEKLRKEFPASWAQLTRAKRRLNFIQEELETQLNLLKIDVELAETKFKAAVAELQRGDTLLKRKAVSQQEYEQLRNKMDLASLSVMRARTVLNLYVKINQRPANETPSTRDAGRQ